ncbi:hypothetical protein ACFWP5_29460, partial [Streptomyces sp. NPDC058469]
MAVEAIRAQEHRALLSHRRTGLGPIDEGDGRFVVGEVNEEALFGRVTAVVRHGDRWRALPADDLSALLTTTGT